jgi:hypothetical protein
MHGGKANSKEEYSGGLQHLPYDNFKHFSKPKRLRTSQPFIQKRPEEGHSTGLPPSLGRWLAESPKEGHWNALTLSKPTCNLPARTFAKEAEKVAIGRDNYTTCPLPQQPLVDSDESTESENPTSSNKEAVEPDEVRLLARKVYTVLGSVAD